MCVTRSTVTELRHPSLLLRELYRKAGPVSRFSLSFPTNTVLLMASISLGLYFLVSVTQRTAQVYQLRQEEVRLQREVGSLEARHQQLVEQRDRLQSDPDIEKIAREQLNLIKPGETAVIVLPNKEAITLAQQQQPLAVPQQEAPPFWKSWWAWLITR